MTPERRQRTVLGWLLSAAALLAALGAKVERPHVVRSGLAERSAELAAALRAVAAGGSPAPMDATRVLELREELAGSASRPVSPSARAAAYTDLLDALGRASLMAADLRALDEVARQGVALATADTSTASAVPREAVGWMRDRWCRMDATVGAARRHRRHTPRRPARSSAPRSRRRHCASPGAVGDGGRECGLVADEPADAPTVRATVHDGGRRSAGRSPPCGSTRSPAEVPERVRAAGADAVTGRRP
jgi:hypothetical protein